MERRITVVGTGRLLVKPDYIEISMRLVTKDKNYDKAMGRASDRLESLNLALCSIGFSKDDIKTSDFSVSTTSEYKDGIIGRSKLIDTGFEVSQKIKVSFDMDMKRLAKTLGVISKWGDSDPDLSVDFTVKDTSAVKDALLQLAAKNARHQAEVLCEASGAKLGDLVSIDYSWTGITFRSKTTYRRDSKTITSSAMSLMSDTCDVNNYADMQPDDIDARDSAKFIWAIE